MVTLGGIGYQMQIGLSQIRVQPVIISLVSQGSYLCALPAHIRRGESCLSLEQPDAVGHPEPFGQHGDNGGIDGVHIGTQFLHLAGSLGLWTPALHLVIDYCFHLRIAHKIPV